MSYTRRDRCSDTIHSAVDWLMWSLLATILVVVVVLGFFLPAVSIVLMSAPIILPPLRAAADQMASELARALAAFCPAFVDPATAGPPNKIQWICNANGTPITM
jgi:hypothetical protein